MRVPATDNNRFDLERFSLQLRRHTKDEPLTKRQSPNSSTNCDATRPKFESDHYCSLRLSTIVSRLGPRALPHPQPQPLRASASARARSLCSSARTHRSWNSNDAHSEGEKFGSKVLRRPPNQEGRKWLHSKDSSRTTGGHQLTHSSGLPAILVTSPAQTRMLMLFIH